MCTQPDVSLPLVLSSRALLIAMLLSLLFLLLLRFIAGVLVWVLIVGVLVVTAYGEYNQDQPKMQGSGNRIWESYCPEAPGGPL